MNRKHDRRYTGAMTDLDDPEVYTRFDPSNMIGRIGQLPQQCSEAWQSIMDFPLPSDYSAVEKVVILGMGGSAIGGDLVSALALEEGPPVLVHRDYDLPFVDEGTLVIASSYSGNTEETLSSFAKALQTPAKKLAITTGGRLKTLAEERGTPVFCFQYLAEPRAAFGYIFFSLLGLFRKLGLISIESKDIDETIRVLEGLSTRLDKGAPLNTNQAKQLATKLFGRLVLVYGAGILSKVAFRWKTQINENSKTSAFYECFPELDHNAVVGYRFPSWLAEKAFVVMLRSPSLHPRTLIRYKVTAEILADARMAHEVVEAEGESPLSQIMSAVLLGDYVSYYLAMLNNVDPSPVAVIDYLKERLGKIEVEC
ncbi:MAG: bifunctional phosphoglucose/phosphomannose isomerase [Dehalococcoidia bacterium]|nr:MAG: bifunctional phosphoglucose/phosphomannose isomerase [Dehalococcoidia bacterium]